jgi:hypothetical protein
MATTEIASTTWFGGSKTPYKYYIFDINANIDPNQDGNYIFAKKEGNLWKAVYMGEGDLQTRKNAAISDGCVKRKGATHFHAHLNANETVRFNEETDILKTHPESYDPSGCNKKIGG